MVRSVDGCTLILNDVVGNIRDAKGFGGWLLRLAGFAAAVDRVGRHANADAHRCLNVGDRTDTLKVDS